MTAIIRDLGYLVLGLNTLLFTFFTKGGLTPSLYWFRWYHWCMVAVQVATRYHSAHGLNNLWLSHFYSVLQLITVSLVYRNLFNSIRYKKTIQYILYGTLVALGVQYVWVPGLFWEFNVLEVYICSLPLAVYAALYLFRSIETYNKKWLFFLGGLVLYLLTSSLVFSGADVLLRKFTHHAAFINFWNVNNLVYLIYLGLTTLEWAYNFRTNKIDNTKNDRFCSKFKLCYPGY